MTIARDTWIFFVRQIKHQLRQPVWILSSLMAPLLYILLFAPLLKGMADPPLTTAKVLDSFVPGILTLVAFSVGMGSGWTVISELESGVVERFRVTPASRFSMLMGVVWSNIVAFVVPGILVVAISAFLGFAVHVGGLLVLIVMLCLLTAVVSAWSVSLGLILKQVSGLAAVVTTLQLPLTLLSGCLLPLSLGPTWLEGIAHIDPMYYTVEASRQLANGVINCSQTWVGFAVMVPLTAVVLTWATRVYRTAVA